MVRSATPPPMLGITLAATLVLTAACGADEFAPSDAPAAKAGGAGVSGGPPGASGSAGQATAGAAGTAAGGSGGTASSAGSSGQAGVAGASGSTGGSATGGSAGAGGGSASAGAGGNPASGGAAGSPAAGGSGGVSAAGAGGAGGAALPLLGPVSLKVFANKDCTGETYKNDDATFSVPQGAGDLCVLLTGSLLGSDAVKIDGDIVTHTVAQVGRSAVWSVPHGGGTKVRDTSVEVIRGAETVKIAIAITPRTVTSGGSDTLGVGTTKRPWKTLARALAGAKNDAIVLSGAIDPGVKGLDVKPVDVPAGALITAAPGTSAQLRPWRGFALRDGSKIAGVAIDGVNIIGPCIEPIEGSSSLEDVLLSSPEGGVAVTRPNVKMTVVGGKITSLAPLLLTGPGSMLVLRHVAAVPGEGLCRDGLRVVGTAGQPAPILEMDASGEPSTFDGFRNCFGIIVQGNVAAVVQNVRVSKSGLVGGGPSIAVDVDKKAFVRDITVGDAVTRALAVQAPEVDVVGAHFLRAGGDALVFGEGKFRVSELEVIDALDSAVLTDPLSEVTVAGPVTLRWSSDFKPSGGTAAAGMEVRGKLKPSIELAVPTTVTIEGAPGVSLLVAGKATFVGSKSLTDGLQIKDGHGTSILFEGEYAFSSTFGRIDPAYPSSDALTVLDGNLGKGKATFKGTELRVGNKAASQDGVPYSPPNPVYANASGSPLRKHVVTSVFPTFAMITVVRVPSSDSNDVYFAFPAPLPMHPTGRRRGSVPVALHGACGSRYARVVRLLPALHLTMAGLAVGCDPVFHDVYCQDSPEPLPSKCARLLGGNAGASGVSSGAAGASGTAASPAGRGGAGSGGRAGAVGAGGAGQGGSGAGGIAGTGGATIGGSAGAVSGSGGAGKGAGAGTSGAAGQGGAGAASGGGGSLGGSGGGGFSGGGGGLGGVSGAGAGGSPGGGGSCALGPAACGAIVEVALGAAHACLRRTDGAVFCWGSNARGQVGSGTTSPTPTLAPQRVASLAAEKITAGGDVSCSVTTDGDVACWGDDTFGQLGRGAPVSASLGATPGLVVSLPASRSVTVGPTTGCAVASSGAVRCWGDNRAGQLGAAPALSRTPVLSEISTLAAPATEGVGVGPTRVTAVSPNRVVVALGGDRFADEGPDNSTSSAIIGETDGIRQVAAGRYFACALSSKDAFTVGCWGRGDEGQLGSGGASAQNRSLSWRAVSLLSGVAAVATGDAHVCAARATGEVYCWGDCSQGQCGNGQAIGTTAPLAAPVLVPGLSGVTGIFAGGSGTCALLGTGEVRCWGAVAGAPATPTPTPLAAP